MLAFCFGVLFVINLVLGIELANTCGPDQFPCNDGTCVEKTRWCDTRHDCDDDSDELYCFLKSGLLNNPNRCNETLFFLCNDGRCIPSVGRCDGFSSCFDNSDEENCGTTALDTPVSLDTDFTINVTEILTPLNYDSKSSASVYDHKTMMQADHAPDEVANKNTYSVSDSDSSKNNSTINLKQTYHIASKTNLAIDGADHVSKDLTNSNLTHSHGLVNHRQPLKFREVLGGILNVSQSGTNKTGNSISLQASASKLDKSTSEPTPLVLNNERKSGQLENRMAQADSQPPQQTSNKDLTEGYVILSDDFRKVEEKALKWLIASRDEDYGWGEETARALTALSMAKYSVGKSSDVKESKLMAKQLHLKLFTLMSRNETRRVPLSELALHINALSASCDNPKNFHGHDLVKILRYRTDDAQKSSKLVTPFVYLVLCLNNASSYSDYIKVQQMMYDRNFTETDSEAVTSLAATCISRVPEFSSSTIGNMAARKLLLKLTSKGLPRNIYELALVTQALNEARINQDLWNRIEAMELIRSSQNHDGSFGDILSTYYVIPTLSGKSFLSVKDICSSKESGLTPVEVLKNGEDEKIYIQYVLRFGNPLEMSQSLMIKVQKNTSFLDIMRIAATINPAYKFKYAVNEDKLTVYSIGGIVNDAEKGLYWTPYTSRNTTIDLLPFEGDIRSFIPSAGEHVAFWRKPIF